MMIEIDNLSFAYTKQPVLKDVSLGVKKGSVVSLLGPNGVGKSTLFKCVLGLLQGYEGSIFIGGQNIKGFSPKELAKQIAYVPQSHYPAFQYSVFDMVLMGTSSQVSAFSSPGKKQQQTALEALEKLAITHLAHRDFMRISGGEKQLVLIARALAQQAPVLMMDEPTANLDYGNQMHVLCCIQALAKEGYTIIQSTHHPEQSFMFSDQIIAMLEGKLIAQGPPKDVIKTKVIKKLYNIDTKIESLYEDHFRICLPMSMLP